MHYHHEIRTTWMKIFPDFQKLMCVKEQLSVAELRSQFQEMIPLMWQISDFTKAAGHFLSQVYNSHLVWFPTDDIIDNAVFVLNHRIKDFIIEEVVNKQTTRKLLCDPNLLLVMITKVICATKKAGSVLFVVSEDLGEEWACRIEVECGPDEGPGVKDFSVEIKVLISLAEVMRGELLRIEDGRREGWILKLPWEGSVDPSTLHD